jgi:hypothetical protein
MREYRAQLDAERAKKLARGSNHATLREKVLKKSKIQDLQIPSFFSFADSNHDHGTALQFL